MLPADIECIVAATIDEFHPNRQRFKGSEIVEKMRSRCLGAGLSPPGKMTAYRRLNALPQKAVVKARHGAKTARDRFGVITGHFPETQQPLEVVQIDHTPVDVIAVDEMHRRPIGRPWLTLAIDINTRMVVGFLLSLDPPSATSMALPGARRRAERTRQARRSAGTTKPTTTIPSATTDTPRPLPKPFDIKE